MIDYPKRVRIAAPEDEEEAMELCRQLHSENGIFSFSEEKVRATLRRSLNREGGILGLIGNHGSIEAMIYLMFGQFWYSEDQHLEELYSYVRPEYRKSKNASDLIQFAKWCAETSNMYLVIGVMSDHRTAGKVRLYQRSLSDPIGAFFLYPKKQPQTDDI
jgi:hypothetical protein